MPTQQVVYFLSPHKPTEEEREAIYQDHGEDVKIVTVGEPRGQEDCELAVFTVHGPLKPGEKFVICAPTHDGHHRLREKLHRLGHLRELPRLTFHT